MTMLDRIDGPDDLKALDPSELTQLAREIRDFLITSVARTGGHLGPNLGVVELTIALHRVFDSPTDALVFDTGHQTYVHKLLTGRRAGFDKLRKRGGLSGYPSRAESEHDLIENSHASTSLSYADGLAKAFAIRGEKRHVVAVIGDGALTGGMAWEALNNIATAKNRPVVIVVNDNGRSYAPTVGGLADHLAGLRTDPRYEQVMELVKSNLARAPLVGQPLYDVLHGLKKGLKDVVNPQGMFEDLGLKYIGPIDGHDLDAMEQALERAKGFTGPVIVHAVTKKGLGYLAAERDEEDRLHSPSKPFDPELGPEVGLAADSWTHAFRQEMRTLGRERPDIVAITAAMMYPTGLDGFAAEFPNRFFDVGIAEQHAVTSAAGLAMGGLHPVVALYATFLNRAFDQVLLDVGMHRLGVTFVLDRAGVTGTDGPSHNGMWDMSIMNLVPGLRMAAPRDAVRLRAALRTAVDVSDAPTVVRYAKGAAPVDIEALEQRGGCDVLQSDDDAEVLLVAIGSMVPTCLDVAERLAGHGVRVTTVDPVWVKPLPAGLTALAAAHRLVVTVEDNGRIGGVGSEVMAQLSDAGVDVPVVVCAIPQEYLTPGDRGQVLDDCGLTPQQLTRRIVEAHARVAGGVLDPQVATVDSARPDDYA
jgi:1-deoxy-D-xylulose-5-phosphate synthase